MYVLKNIASQKANKGVVEAGQFEWHFTWSFNKGYYLLSLL